MTFMHHRPAMTYSPEGTEQFPDPEVPETTTPPIKNPEAETAADRSDVLARICARTRVDIEQRSQIMSLKDITARAREVTTPTRGFGQALQHLTADRQVGLIAEIKKASPSAGILRPDYDPVKIAQDYQAAGATCLSVLTEGSCFHGSTEDIRVVREACSLPILRKDFILDPWQVHESRLIGADCILLIMAVLTETQAAELIAIARGLDMDVLLEVHDEAELNRALALDTFLIGINNRNLRTLKTDIQTTIDLAPMVPPDRLVVSESGIRTQDDMMKVGAVGASAVLVGESLLREPDPGVAARRLLGFI
ncbi:MULTISPECIES: indole-3-glycerol phosphate synthase TrpC [Gluconobacter]|uniref:Indole-3-glycerol phosphate synthase n=2 Tax=Gluconobacter TaxID=441 RepID=A0ABR9YXH9_9PROT|nr:MULTISPECIES: indole-3-glycerol phosphate synthase TrpC [Gluconobacter]MBF0889257.1 indole-3-glycerol phosphate synthase TrpC [Gluconobacter cadivus]MBN3866386.1 indole-3-glycerol phosphate synthase TrpC [Gluconobacter kondonii]MBS1053932.1 indole-3-glycerol phosphate synthase TrpC [Gluconobacter kondonii]MBS1057311.1 indole-3-glycerol phosphate synthase TrpC [Gluconobacter kondonii]MBS1060671.1 indole-3-glycerol phosphate synthase TrpC [Gluconobacter sp. Dm-44]